MGLGNDVGFHGVARLPIELWIEGKDALDIDVEGGTERNPGSRTEARQNDGRMPQVPQGVDDLAHLADSVLVVGSARGVAEIRALAPTGEVHPEGGATRQGQRP